MPEVARRHALIFTVVTAAAMVAAICVYVFVGDGSDDADGGNSTFTAQEQAAISAAQTEVANLSSFRRAHFDADFQRALDGVTGALVTDIKAKKATTLKALTDGKFDLSAEVTHTALIGPVDDDKVTGYNVLVSFNGFRSTQRNQPTQQNLSVTVVRKNGKWLLNQVTAIGVS